MKVVQDTSLFHLPMILEEISSRLGQHTLIISTMSLRLGSPTITFLHNALNESLPVKEVANRAHKSAHDTILFLKRNHNIVENYRCLCGSKLERTILIMIVAYRFFSTPLQVQTQKNSVVCNTAILQHHRQLKPIQQT